MTTSNYEFDAERFCRVRARSARAQRNFADEQNFLRVAEEVKRLREEVATLKEAARPVVKWYTRSKRHFPDEFRPRDVALEYDGSLGAVSVICLELDALAALVGEE